MSKAPLPLRAYVDRLRNLYGRPKRPIPSGPFEWIIWENVANLVDDEVRATVFRNLRQRIGTTPQAILRTPRPKMLELIGPGGTQPPRRLAKLRESAELMLEIGLAKVRTLLREAPAEAKKLLKRFPGIGEPGAEKILLFCKTQASLAPESNGLRVLTRLGFGNAGKGYAQMYNGVTAAIAPELPRDYNWLIQAHQLLRRHGQEICKTTPRCEACPLSADCLWYRRSHG
jgi:endonuclease III